jgi:hypothetical protein
MFVVGFPIVAMFHTKVFYKLAFVRLKEKHHKLYMIEFFSKKIGMF